MKKKILFVINTLGTAGAEKALLELLDRIDTSKYEVSLFVLMNQGELRLEIPESVHFLNDRFVDLPIHTEQGLRALSKHVLRSLFKAGTVIKCMPYLVRNSISMIAKGKLYKDKLLWRAMAMAAPKFDTEFDLAVSYIEGGSAYYVRDYVKAKKKVSFIHIDYKNAGYTRKLDRDCYLDFERIYPVSDEVKDTFLLVYPELKERTFVFHNILNIEKIKRMSLLEGGFPEKKQNETIILSIGRLNVQKSFETSIDAMKILKERGIAAKWFILGEGDQRKFLEERIKKLELQDNFFLPGNQSNPYTFLRQCDIYVHASKFEGKSIAIQEAQALSKPIIVSDCNGNREQVSDGIDGLICDLSAESIADSIEKLIANNDLADEMGRRAFEKISELTKSDDMLKDLLGVIE